MITEKQTQYKKEFYFRSSDMKTEIHGICWMPSTEVKAVVQIVHGIAEHAKRYEDFALFLNKQGYAVISHDHKGHGKSISSHEPRLYFGEKGSWWYAVKDVCILQQHARKQFGNVPYFMFGHSMGSFIMRSYLIKNLSDMDGCILCGTGYPNKFEVYAGQTIVYLTSLVKGRKAYSPMVDRLIFGGFNKKFENTTSNADWVSKNQDNIQAYLHDSMCGGDVTIGLFQELLYGSAYCTRMKNIEQMNKKIPVYFISGSDDPVGNMSKGVKKTYDAFKKAGMKDVQIQLYPGLRHEILNEKENQIVYEDILNWLQTHL